MFSRFHMQVKKKYFGFCLGEDRSVDRRLCFNTETKIDAMRERKGPLSRLLFPVARLA